MAVEQMEHPHYLGGVKENREGKRILTSKHTSTSVINT